MKAVIFAGGVGTRLWPLSRKKSPKQFEKIIGDKSTLQLAVDRLLPDFDPKDIYISTGAPYVELVREQLKIISKNNIIGEPEKKDVGPAVAYMMSHLEKSNPHEPVVILWSDHLVRHVDKFKKLVKSAGEIVSQKQDLIVFIGQKPRFPSENLGWIEVGKVKKTHGEVKFHEFVGFKYRPEPTLAKQYFESSRFCWNLGYFVSTPSFILHMYEKYAPDIYKLTFKITTHLGKPDFEKVFEKHYHEMPKVNFDTAILEQLDKKHACVVIEDIGWSDVGAWEALKEALEKNREDNITKGRVFIEDSLDNLIYNYEGKKLVVGIDLRDLLIINTEDVLLVAKKTSVSKIKKLVENFEGTPNEHLT